MRHLPLLLLLACTDDKTDIVPLETDDDVIVPVGTDERDSDVVHDSEPSTDTDPLPVDSDVPAPQVVRFVALGDAGEGNDEQADVAASIGAVCALRGCDFALYLGDNFYDDGIDVDLGVADPQFQSKFEVPYAALDFPFYVTLGNHDFGQIPLQPWKADVQVSYSQHSTKWTMPDRFYRFDAQHATFLSLDTNMIMLGLSWTQDQGAWARTQIDDARAAGQAWVVAFGHHPWRSNGEHGNVGNYEGAGVLDPTGVVDGTNVKEFFRSELCNRVDDQGNVIEKVDLYLCGHDHNRQWLEPVCGVDLVVSGAGAKTSDFVHRDHNPTVWEDDAVPGFVWVELADGVATLAFYDKDGNLDHEGTLVR